MKEDLKTLPKIELPGLDLSNNQYIVNGNKYDVPSLIQFCKEKKYKPFDLPVAGINLEYMPFTCNSFLSFCNHIKRIDNTSLEHPILLDDRGYVADGWHRVAKAIINGNRSIKAIRMMEMPTPSGKEEDD